MRGNETDMEDWMRDYADKRCPECGTELGLFELHADDCSYNDESEE